MWSNLFIAEDVDIGHNYLLDFNIEDICIKNTNIRGICIESRIAFIEDINISGACIRDIIIFSKNCCLTYQDFKPTD